MLEKKLLDTLRDDVPPRTVARKRRMTRANEVKEELQVHGNDVDAPIVLEI